MSKSVSELSGAELDYWVARACGVKAENIRIAPLIHGSGGVPFCQVLTGFCDDPGAFVFRSSRPSSVWADGGPLVDMHDIVVERVVTVGGATLYYQTRKYPHQMTGPAYLVAAMRVLVASVYGETVPDEVIHEQN